MSLRVTGSQVIFPDQSELKTAPMGFGFKNRIINGDMRIAQRGTSVAINTSGYGGPDRWYGSVSGAGGQFTQSANSFTYNGLVKNTVRQTVNAVATSFASGNFWFGLTQFIEGVNAYDLNGQPISISFIFNTNVTGTYSVALRNGSNTQCYVTTINATANTPTKYTISVPANAALGVPNSNALGLTFCIGFLNQGTYQTATLNAWQAANVLTTTNSVNWAATAGNFIEVTEVQLEKGTTATDFDYRPYSVEIGLCKRYYQVFTGTLFASFTGGPFGGGVVNIYGEVMRTSPTMTIDNINGSGGYTGTLVGDCLYQPYNSFRVWFGGTGTTASAQFCVFLIRASSEL